MKRVSENGEKKKGFSLGIIDFNAPVVLSFALICVIALVLGKITDNKTTYEIFSVHKSKFGFLYVIRIFGHVFGHADYNHFINNMTMFLLLGPIIEEKYGSKNILEMMGITAFVTGILNIIFFPHTVLLGASGIIFMLIVLSSATSLKEKKIPLTLILVLILYLGQQIMAGIQLNDNVSQFTHIVGGVLGAVFGFAYKKDIASKE